MDGKSDPTLLLEYEQILGFLATRGNEKTFDPSLDRISYLMDILGSPQLAFDAIHIAGTNGKTSTSRMLEALLNETGLAVGLTTSPHLHDWRERIRIFQESISMESFVETFRELEPFIAMVDEAMSQPLSVFEILTAMAFMAFAEAPVAVGVVEVGLGGELDATNLLLPTVGVITPIGLDHQEYLGDSYAEIAKAKAGIIKPGMSVVVAEQHPDALAVIEAHAAEVDARVFLAGRDFDVFDRQLAVGGQVLTLRGIAGIYEDILLPLHGIHQAKNAALALVALELFFGADAQGRPLDAEIIARGFAAATSPGRMEVVRRGPTIMIDAAHNPHGIAALLESLEAEFSFDRRVFVIAAFADKDVEGMLALIEPIADHVILTQSVAERALSAEELGVRASSILPTEKFSVIPKLTDAIDRAIALCDAWDAEDLSAGILVTGSITTAAQVRAMFGKRNLG